MPGWVITADNIQRCEEGLGVSRWMNVSEGDQKTLIMKNGRVATSTQWQQSRRILCLQANGVEPTESRRFHLLRRILWFLPGLCLVIQSTFLSLTHRCRTTNRNSAIAEGPHTNAENGVILGVTPWNFAVIFGTRKMGYCVALLP